MERAVTDVDGCAVYLDVVTYSDLMRAYYAQKIPALLVRWMGLTKTESLLKLQFSLLIK